MFGFGKKARAAEAIRRGVRASLTGAYLHPDQIATFGLNKRASAWLYTEAISHHIYALGYVSARALNEEAWATSAFFIDSVVDGMKEASKRDGPSVDQLSSIVLKRFVEFESFSGQDRISGVHYRSSAHLVAKQDSTADIETIARVLKTSTDQYVADARQMFCV